VLESAGPPRDLLLAAVLIACGVAPASATIPASAQSADDAAADASFYRGVAENPTNPLAIRRVALTRLISDPQPFGRAAVLALLDESDQTVRAGLVDALANAPVDAPDLADAVAAAAAAAPPDDRDAWVALLGLAGPGMDALLVEIAVDGGMPVEVRRNALELLGGFPTPISAETLMDVAEGVADESLRSAAFEALRRLSGMPFGDAVEAWRAWWAAGGEELLESTCEQRAETLAARLERAERDRMSVRTFADRAVEQLRQTHAELLLGMDLPARRERILLLLASEFEALRRLAIEQVERMLRNGDRIGDPAMLEAIATLLDDRAAVLRSRAASLLGTLAPDRVGRLVSARLPEEREPTVVAAFLDALSGTPPSETMDAVAERLDDASTAAAAARALIRLHAAGASAGPWTGSAASAARSRLDESPTPVMAELLAIAGDETDDDRLRTLLASEDARFRRAVADGWGRRGRIDALRERSLDPVVYPALAAALVEGEPPFSALETLLGLPRSEESADDFERFATRLLDAMPLAQGPEADRILADSSPPTSLDLRLRGLRRVVEAPVETELEATVRIEAAERLGRLLLDAGRAEDAARALQPQLPLAPERLGPLLFEALALSAEFDAAAARRSDVEAWLDLLERLRDDRHARREAIAREIAKRFPDELDEARWETLRSVVPALGGPETESAPDAASVEETPEASPPADR